MLMPIVVLFYLIAFIPPEKSISTVYVPDDYATIQEGILASSVHGRIIVRAGTYVENIDFAGRPVIVKSEMGPDFTFIDGAQAGSVVTFESAETYESILDGFTVTNGKESTHGGAGIYCSGASPEIRNCTIILNATNLDGGGVCCTGLSTPLFTTNVIEQNSARYGAGFHCSKSSPKVVNNTINDNMALLAGGGIACIEASPMIRNNQIYSNIVHIQDGFAGGGIFCLQSTGTISNNIIKENYAVHGAGLFVEDSDSTITHNAITANIAQASGGGIGASSGAPTIAYNIITGNSTGSAPGSGGGIQIDNLISGIVKNNIIASNLSDNGGGLFCSNGSPTITNNTIAENTANNFGGGIYCIDVSDSEVDNNTITGNTAGAGGGALCLLSTTVAVSNTILWDDKANLGPEIYIASLSYPSTLDIAYSDLKGGLTSVYVEPGSTLGWGLGMIDDNPLFFDPVNANYHLQQDPCQLGVNNPCVDTGDPNGTIIAGSTRTDGVQDSNVLDMGYHYRDSTHLVPDEFLSIQEALDASDDGDSIIVAPGKYFENIEFLGKSVRLESAEGPELTAIDGRQLGAVVTFSDNEGPDTVIAGFTVTNGSGYGGHFGGGIYLDSSSPTIWGNIIIANNANHYGGGICCDDSSAQIVKNIITANTAGNEGAGICNRRGAASVLNNTITDNHVVEAQGRAGGVHYDGFSYGQIKGNLISKNTCDRGGGIQCYHGNPIITGNLITENTAHNLGGGIFCSDCSPAIIGNTIFNNEALVYGGGIICTNSNSVISCNIISENVAEFGAGIAFGLTKCDIINDTIYGNVSLQFGGGIMCIGTECATTIKNTILWNNDAPKGEEIYLGSSYLAIGYSDLDGGQSSVYVGPQGELEWGSGMIDVDPLFVDSSTRDFHLTWGSSCGNAGLESIPGLPSRDFEGDPRVVWGGIDIGADEFYPHLYHKGAVVAGQEIDIVVTGWPNMYVTVGKGSGVLDPPKPTYYGEMYLNEPITIYYPGRTSANGVLIISETVPLSWNYGEEYPFQALAGVIGWPETTLTNLMVLTAE